MPRDWIAEELRRYALEALTRIASAAADAPRPAAPSGSAPLVAALTEHHREVLAWLDGPGKETAESLEETALALLLQRNQFLQLAPELREALGAAYSELLGGLRVTLQRASEPGALDAELAALFQDHERRLASIAGALGSNREGAPLAERACASYSPELQLRVLHVSPEELREPILDLGCGERGELVRHLRESGKTAFGLDRAVPDEELFLRGDWLAHPLGQDRWGTVLSHMAFSNHFLHHHLHPQGQPARYARRYMEILRALSPGGSFVYAPGLPFVEDLLPRSGYALERHPVERVSGSAVDRALRTAVGAGVLYACRVTKRPI